MDKDNRLKIIAKHMLCKPMQDFDQVFSDDIWNSDGYVAEVKLDGSRFFLVIQEPEYVVLDGELFTPDGKHNDTTHNIANGKENLKFCAFDILQVGDELLTMKPLDERRRILVEVTDRIDEIQKAYMISRRNIIQDASWLKKANLKRTKWVFGRDKKSFYETAVANGEEGIVLKNISSYYIPGSRTALWVKVKKEKDYDVVVTDIKIPKNSKSGKYQIHYGFYENGKLYEAGSIKNPQFKNRADGEYLIGKVIEIIGFDQYPESGAVRSPRFRDEVKVREDKDAKDCVFNRVI